RDVGSAIVQPCTAPPRIGRASFDHERSELRQVSTARKFLGTRQRSERSNRSAVEPATPCGLPRLLVRCGGRTSRGTHPAWSPARSRLEAPPVVRRGGPRDSPEQSRAAAAVGGRAPAFSRPPRYRARERAQL